MRVQGGPSNPYQPFAEGIARGINTASQRRWQMEQERQRRQQALEDMDRQFARQLTLSKVQAGIDPTMQDLTMGGLESMAGKPMQPAVLPGPMVPTGPEPFMAPMGAPPEAFPAGAVPYNPTGELPPRPMAPSTPGRDMIPAVPGAFDPMVASSRQREEMARLISGANLMRLGRPEMEGQLDEVSRSRAMGLVPKLRTTWGGGPGAEELMPFQQRAKPLPQVRDYLREIEARGEKQKEVAGIRAGAANQANEERARHNKAMEKAARKRNTIALDRMSKDDRAKVQASADRKIAEFGKVLGRNLVVRKGMTGLSKADQDAITLETMQLPQFNVDVDGETVFIGGEPGATTWARIQYEQEFGGMGGGGERNTETDVAKLMARQRELVQSGMDPKAAADQALSEVR